MDKILHQLIGSLSHYLQGFIHTRRCRISSINSTCQFSSTVCSFPGWPRKVWPQRSWVCWPRTIEPWCLGSSAKTWEKTWNVNMVVLKRKGIRAPKIYAKIQVKDLLVMGFIIDSKHVFQWHCIWCKVSEATKSKHLFSIRDRFRYLKEKHLRTSRSRIWLLYHVASIFVVLCRPWSPTFWGLAFGGWASWIQTEMMQS